VNVGSLAERASEIREAKQSLDEQMRDSEANESSKAESLRMYH